MENDIQSLVSWIKDARKRKGCTLTELGNRSGLTHSQLSRIENGVSDLTLFSLIRIFNAFNYSFTSLFSENLFNSKFPLPSIFLDGKKESYQYPVLRLGDIENFVYFILYRKNARNFIAKWLKHYIENYTMWTEEAISGLLDEAITLLTFPSDDREGSMYENLCYPMDISINKLRNIYLSGGGLIMRDVGAFIRNQRLEKNLSLRALSSKVNISHPWLSRLETGLTDRTLFSDILNLDQELEFEGDLVAFAWRAGELYLGIHKIYDRKEYPIPYSRRDLEWIDRLIIVFSILSY